MKIGQHIWIGMALMIPLSSSFCTEIPLWPGTPPGRIDDGEAEATTHNDGIARVAHVHEPALYAFPASPSRNAGAAVVICPGGGYGIVAIEHEGTDVARWFNALGVSAFVLKYRMSPYKHPIPLMDGQRAMRIVRSRAAEWGVSPNRIGIMGFSAGGHLASTVATHFGRSIDKDGPLANVSCRPDFAILGYPVISFANEETTHKGSMGNLLGPTPDRESRRSLSAELQVNAQTPPAFLFHAKDDRGVVPKNSLALAKAMEAAGVPAQVYLLERGGHGFGMRLDEWLEPCAQWLQRMGIVDAASLDAPLHVRGYYLETGVLSKNVRAFGNRRYVFERVPDAFCGWQFTRLNGGQRSCLRVVAKADMTLYAATSTSRQPIDMAGWTPQEGAFLQYTDGGHTKMPVFTRPLKANEEVRLPEGSWTGVMLMAPRLSTEVLDLHPEHKRVPGVVVDHVPASTVTYVGSPSIVILPDGAYLASHDLFGGRSGAGQVGRTPVFRSEDRGQTWRKLTEIQGQFWSTLFVHRGDVYLMGTNSRHGSVAIRRSSDRGETWTEPVDEAHGLLLTGAKYHCAPVPVAVHAGRIWRAMEDAMGPGGWGHYFRAFMMSAPVGADLLQAASWTCSNRLGRDPSWLDGRFGGWLEGNAVVTPDGQMVNVLRVDDRRVGAQAAVIRISADGTTATFDPQDGFVDFPGANSKFTIRFDPESRLYWSLTNYVPTLLEGRNKGGIRNTLALIASPDLEHWEVRAVPLFHPDPSKHAFQYVDWQFDGSDVVVASRTAYDDGLGGAHNFHDANYLTFHRIRGFREETLRDAHPLFKLYAGLSDCAEQKQVTSAECGHILTNANVWSPDSEWLAYDVRRVGRVFDGDRIERVNVGTGEVQVLYRSQNGAKCGVVTHHPSEDRVVFIHGPENPSPDWEYAAYHRRGVIVGAPRPGVSVNLDARDLSPPFTPGALRGGTHVHTFSGDGEWVSSTYEDHVLAQLGEDAPTHDINQRNIAVSVPGRAVSVGRDHPRNHDGQLFTVLVTRTVNDPKPGSDEISKAFSDAWVGTKGYLRPDGTRQHRAIAFQGHARTDTGGTLSEAFIVDLPDDLTAPGDGPLEGTATRRPSPPKGVVQRRLTHTAGRKTPGLRGPRHWLRSSPDGSRIAFLMEDHDGVVQFWTVSPNGGQPVQVTRNPWDVQSAFSWSPNGRRLAYVMDNSVFVTDVRTGASTRLTKRCFDRTAPTPHACVYSPDGRKIAYTRPVDAEGRAFDQIFVVDAPD